AHDPHVGILNGDSGQLLSAILRELRAPALFWLDAHYSGDGTAKAAIETPILSELTSILSHAIRNHVVLIDDARLFNGLNDYPSMREVTDIISSTRPDLDIHVGNDMIRIYPRAVG